MTHNTSLTILSTAIRQDAGGRFCLNDCWGAAGKPEEKKPSNWNDLLGTKELVEEICQSENLTFGGKQPLFVKRGGNAPGIWACKELVYAYAMWISPAFHLQVIRAFDAMVMGKI
ncbi:KilA-N domain-containing protein [Komagataeibacter sp. FNDCR1]|nr:KilA-N domain-containing protein [Komagataeibacter sp. FNDCR1]